MKMPMKSEKVAYAGRVHIKIQDTDYRDVQTVEIRIFINIQSLNHILATVNSFPQESDDCLANPKTLGWFLRPHYRKLYT
eukprot:UN08852